MYKRILVPLDGSTFAAQAIPYARLLAGALRSDIELFSVAPTLPDLVRGMTVRGYRQEDNIGGLGPGASYEQWQEIHEQVKRDIAGPMEAAAKGLGEAGLTVRTTVAEGDIAETITREAGDGDDTLIAMTTHGRSGVSRWWLGSVADRTVRMANAPVLVVRCTEEGEAPSEPVVRSVLLPLDGSRFAEQAIPHAVALAKALGARVDVLLAIHEPDVAPIRYPVPDGFTTGANARAGEYGANIVDRLRQAGIDETAASVVEADAPSAITELGETTPDSLIVMSTHGRSGIRRWMMGSVADKVVRHSGRPVLLVRAREAVGAVPEAVA